MSNDQVRTGGGGQATPKDLPDAPVPWQRSDAKSMRPAEDGSDLEPERDLEPAEDDDRRPVPKSNLTERG